MTLKDSVFAQNGHMTCDIPKRIPNMCNFHVARNHQTRGIALSWQSCDRDLCWDFL